MSRPVYPVVRSIVSVFLGLFLFADLMASPASAAELFPGRIVDVAGRQADFVIRWNPFRDEYILGYSNGRSVIGHMDTDGNFFNQVPISNTSSGVTHVDLAYDSNRNQWLFVWRNGSPQTMFGRFLDTDGNPIGTQFSVGTGKDPHLAFSPAGDVFAMAFTVGGGSTKYKTISPDHTLSNPVLSSGNLSSADALSARLVYGSVANKFLFVYVRDFAPLARQADVFGRFLNGNGTNLGAEFGIDTSSKTQNGPVVGYTPSANRFIVGYQTWEASPPNVKVRLVNPNGGGVTRTFQPATTSAWEVPGAIVYNPTTDTVTFAWRHGSNNLTDGRAREWEVSDASARAVGPLITLSDLDPNIVHGAARPDSVEPQVTIVWQKGFGNDGIHAGIIGVTPPPPDLTAPADVTDLAGTTGGPSLLLGSLLAHDVSNEAGANVKENAVDDAPGTYWGTPTSTVLPEEFITVDLGSSKSVEGVELWSRTSGDFFPLDYEIEVSLDDVTYEPAFSMTGAVVPAGTSIRHQFAAKTGQYVRLRVVTPRAGSTGKYKVQIGDIDVFEKDTTAGAVTATWTAPGDDDDVGGAASYDLRWSLTNITNDSEFNAATVVPSLPVPQLAGNLETVQITSLPDETQVFLAVKTSDEAANESGLSNFPVAVNTPGIPPAPVDDLVAAFETSDSARLTWSATADDGSNGASGPASMYDLRWHTSPLTESNFSSGTMVAVPFLPASPNVGELFIVEDLPPETDIYFGIRVMDELGNTSLVDTSPTEPMVTTLDWQPPDPPFLEHASGAASASKVAAPAFDSSGDSSTSNGLGKSTDSDPATRWTSLSRTVEQDEFLSVDTGAPRRIVQVKMLSRNTKSFFPEDLEIHTSLDDVTYTPVATFSGLPDTASFWHTLDIPATNARYVKILMTKMRQARGGNYKAEVAEIEVYESPTVFGQITLEFDAPGDNGMQGTATSYDVRYSTVPITAVNFNTRSQFATGPPLTAGSRESIAVTGLNDETMYYFAMTASDGVNTSFISNILEAATPGVTPDPVTSLVVTNTYGTSMDLGWAATADDGSNPASGAADHYDIRFSLAPISEANFDSATPVTPTPPTPSVFGTGETHTITGLNDDTHYYLAIRVVDEVGHMSPIQMNGIVMAATNDITPPAQITTLAASAASPSISLADADAVDASSQKSDSRAKEFATDGVETTFWNSKAVSVQQDEFITVDLGSEKTFSRVRLLTSLSANLFPNDLRIQASNTMDSGFYTVHEAFGLSTAHGIWHELDFPTASARYVRIYITDTRKNGGDLYQARIAEIEVYESAVGGAVNLMWPSPGDDPGVGSPTSYDIRSSSSTITTGNFVGATPIGGPAQPAAFGVAESFDVPAPNEGAIVHFAMTATDEAGNPSSVSNDASFSTVVTPPAPVLGLAASNVTSVTARLSWAATGDDGFVGTATLFDVRMSTALITDANFGSAAAVPSLPTPGSPGTIQVVDVSGLTPATNYYFAMKVEDENAAASTLSNVVMITTDAPDAIAPDAIIDLRGGTPFNVLPVVAPAVDSSGDLSDSRSKEKATDGDPVSYWNSNLEPVVTPEFITLDMGSSKPLARVEILSRNKAVHFPVSLEIQVSDSINSGFTTAHAAFDLPNTASMLHTFDFTPVTGRYVRIYITETRSAGGTFKARLAEINVYEGEFIAGPITLSFTAPGDDGDVGTASYYDVRWSTSLIDGANFHLANPIAVDMPNPAGTVESLVIDGLTDNLIYFAIRGKDEVPNLPAISNVIMVTNPDP